MRLIRAELLKIRRRQATWVLLVLTLVLFVLIWLLSSIRWQFAGIVEFPAVYGAIGEYAYGLGALLGVVYAAVLVGSDYSWGVMRNVVARGESRAWYLLAKAIAIAIVLGIALLLLYAIGIVLAFLTGPMVGVPVSNPLRGNGLLDLLTSLLLGYPVLLERAALGFAVAVVLRSQVAGAVIGIVFFLGESILRVTLLLASIPGRAGGFFDGGGSFEPTGPDWYQFLPISVGDYVTGASPGGSGGMTAFLEQFLIRPVPFEIALVAVLLYMGGAMALAIGLFSRQEIA